MAEEWREYKAPRAGGNIWDFRRGYRVSEVGRHEKENEFNAFLQFLHARGNRDLKLIAELAGVSDQSIRLWHDKYNWQKRAAAYDVKETAIVWRDSEKLTRNKHKEAIVEFRDASERQARLMSKVSEDLLSILAEKVASMDGVEDIPVNMVPNLLKAVASVSGEARQAWAASLGVNEMLEMVEEEIQKVDVEVLDETDPYDIPIDQD